MKSLLHFNNASPKYEILALTRKATTPRAQKLASLPNVKVIEGDLNDISAVFGSQGKIDSVFSVQTVSMRDHSAEETQGKV